MEKGSRKKPFMYGLSTCGWCAKARSWLDEHASSYDLVYVDLLDPKEKNQIVDDLNNYTDNLGFPVIFFGDDIVVGYQPAEYERLLEK
jgi:glutaredoxin